jgi:putative transport protein
VSEDIIGFMRGNPVFTFFVILALGYLLGKIRVGPVSPGPVAGVLFAGLFFGNYGFTMSPAVQAVGFALFIFSVGYQAGPRFFDVLMSDGLRYLVLAGTVAITGIAVAVVASRTLGLDPGTGAGVLAGGLTSSPTLAAAQDAVLGGTAALPEGWNADQVVGNIATGYAITYIFGLAGLIFLIKLLPRFLGIDLVEEARKLETDHAGRRRFGEVGYRAYVVTNPGIPDVPLAELRKQWDGFSWVRVRRGNQVFKARDIERLETGDVVTAMGAVGFLTYLQILGDDVTDEYLGTEPVETADVVVTAPGAVGKTLAELGIPGHYGVYVEKLRRMRYGIPRTVDAQLLKGDVLTVVGPSGNVTALGEALGSVERETPETDLVTFAIGIAAGAVLGTLSITIGDTPIGLGAAGGLLVAGIIVGFLRSLRPTFGQLPEAARWLLMELGLLIFMMGVGLRAGAEIVDTFRTAGPQLIAAGILVTVIPVLAGYFVGRKILKFNPAILFGAITGSMTSGASLAIVTESAKSDVPALGYTGTYAFANVLLTIAGGLMIAFG